MKRAIIRNNILLLGFAFLLFFVIVFFSLYSFDKRNKETFMTFILNEVEIQYVQFDGTDEAFVDNYAYVERRITIMNEDAIVVADTHHDQEGYDESDQHEIMNLSAISSRNSAHIGEELLYLAKQLDDGTIIRVSVPLETHTELYTIIIWVLLSGSLIIGILYYFGLREVNKHLLKPWDKVKNGMLALNEGRYQLMSLTSPYPEINELLHELNLINEQTADHLAQIDTYRMQLDYILNMMGQGILLFNKEENLIYANDEAKHIFLLEEDDMHAPSYYFVRDHELQKVIHDTNELENDYVIDVHLEASIYETRSIHLTTKANDHFRPSVLVVLKEVTKQRELEQMKRDFIAHASHELKSPLTVIKGNAELIHQDVLKNKKDIVEAAKTIDQQSMQMARLIEDMLMLSRLENIEEKPLETYDLNVILKKVLDQLNLMIKDKDIRIEVNASETLMVCDELDMHKLFKNIIENAIKYSDHGKKVHVFLHKDKEEIVFKVIDEGMGIPKDQQRRVFERFYRIDKGRMDKGTGLGLAIVKHIVLKYKGHVELESSLQKGTTITVKI